MLCPSLLTISRQFAPAWRSCAANAPAIGNEELRLVLGLRPYGLATEAVADDQHPEQLRMLIESRPISLWNGANSCLSPPSLTKLSIERSRCLSGTCRSSENS